MGVVPSDIVVEHCATRTTPLNFYPAEIKTMLAQCSMGEEKSSYLLLSSLQGVKDVEGYGRLVVTARAVLQIFDGQSLRLKVKAWHD